MDIPLHAPVQCTDGVGGRIITLIINPVTDAVTHVVVREEGMLAAEVMVPIERIIESTPQSIQLRCTRAELAAMEPFQTFEYLPHGSDTDGREQLVYWPYAAIDPLYMPLLTEHIPAGELAIRRGASVSATDGHVGQVDEFLVDTNNHITHLVMREGHLWGKKDVTIPVAQLDHFAENMVYLKLDRAQVAALPAIPIIRRQPRL